MGFFDFLRGDSSSSSTTTSSRSTSAAEAQKLRVLIEALKNKDENVLLSPSAVPSSISSDNQGLAAEAFGACVQCASNLAVSSLLSGMFGGGSGSSRLDDEAIESIAGRLLSAGLAPNTYCNGEPLVFAAIDGNGSLKEFYVDALIERGANLNVTNKDGYSPLGDHLKSEHDGGSINYHYESYVSHDARLNEKDLSDFDVYKSICRHGLYEIARTIPRAKLESHVGVVDEKTGMTLLQLAAGGMQIGAHQSLQDMFRKSYLANDGYPALVKLLLDCGADPLKKSRSGHDALSIASLFGHTQVFNILNNFAQRESPNAASSINEPLNGMGTQLFNACYLGDVDTARALLAAGADPNARSFVNYPEDKLFQPGMPQEIGALLMQHYMAKVMNPSFFSRMELGLTNLYYSAINNQADIVHLLLEAGADPNAISLNGLFPLYVAAEIGSLPIVRDLVAHGADVNKKTPKGCTAILNAAEEGMLNVVEFLLENGADPYIRSNAGKTAIDAAIEAGKMDAAQLMRNYR